MCVLLQRNLHLIFSSPLFRSVSWCVLSDAEEQKCLDLAGNATARNIRGNLQCVRGLNTRDCMDRIKVPEETGKGKWIVQSVLHNMTIFTLTITKKMKGFGGGGGGVAGGFRIICNVYGNSDSKSIQYM